MKFLTLPLGALFLMIAFTGCATDPNDSTAASASSIPWNRPASWEGTGALGGFASPGGAH